MGFGPAAFMPFAFLLVVAEPAHAEIASQQAEAIGEAATICRDIVGRKIDSPGQHSSHQNFTRDAASGLWLWVNGEDQVAINKVVENEVTYCDVLIVSPRASDADIQRVTLIFALDNGYRVADGSSDTELMLASSDASVFLLRRAAPGWRINFEP